MSKVYASILALCCLLTAAASWADKFSDAADLFRNAGASRAYFDDAYGYAVFPTIGKVGFGIGGAHGKGRVFVQGEPVGETTMTQLSVGLQVGGEAYSQIVFFEDQRAFEDFSSGNFEFGANASAVAITAGVSARAGTTGSSAGASGGKRDATTTAAGYRKGMAVFTIAKAGLMVDASLGGQRFTYAPLGGD